MRSKIYFILILCLAALLFVGCVREGPSLINTSAHDDTTTSAPSDTTTAPVSQDTTTPPVEETTPPTPQQTTPPEDTTTVTVPTVTTEPGLVTAPAGDGWSDFH
ncbi:MAG: hypothetical protein IJY27_03080 [Clostridia bacterium]|nr:hypothetical protein [Clostridia bacterium]